MLSRNFIVTGFIALGLMALAPVVVHAEDNKAEAPAAASDEAAPAAKADDAAAKTDEAAGKADEAVSKEDQAAADAIRAAMVHGPAKIDLGDQATVDLPKDFVFLPKEQSLALMEQMGNKMDRDNFYGLFLPENDEETWFVAASFDDSGYIKDDDQAKIDADEILTGMKKSVAEDNEDRKAKGVSQLEIVGWIEKPHYDSKTHHLIWSIEAKEFGGGEPASDDNSINYNTFALGRGGDISLNLVSKRSTIEKDRKAVATLLNNLKFNDGKKYENFDPKTDKVAEYGLMALIGGLAVKKLGLFALAAAFAAKSAKILVVAAAAGVAAIKKFFKRRDPSV